MSESKVCNVSEVLEGKVSRSDTYEIGLKEKGGNETLYNTHIYHIHAVEC